MKVVGAVSVFNEEDIMKEWIDHHLSQELELIIVDGGSTDSTFDICKKFADKDKIKLFRINDKSWDLVLDLRRKYELALTESPDWIIHMDGDEFFESGVDGLTLKNAIKRVDEEGYNLIQFNRFEFFMPQENENSYGSIVKHNKFYSFETDFIYRAWKFYPGIFIEPAGGHYPIFPPELKYKIYPNKMICRHYRFRNKKQAEEKLRFRTERTKNTPDLKIGWHSHLKKIQRKDSLFVDYNKLTKHNEDSKWNEKETFSYFPRKHRKKEEIFSNDGRLLIKHPSYNELKLTVTNLKKKIINDQLPNFFIVGAPRCGTTLIYRNLKTIPGIFMSFPKEPNFFSAKTVPETMSNHNKIIKIFRNKDEYLHLFEKGKLSKIVGEGTTHYLADPEAPRLIHQMTPNAKILISLRDPVEREFSDYVFLIAIKILNSSFGDILEKSFQNNIREDPGIKVEVGLYSENVKRYLDIFGDKQVKILIFEDLIKNPKDQFKEILKFLEIEYDVENLNFKPVNSFELLAKQPKPTIPELEKKIID